MTSKIFNCYILKIQIQTKICPKCNKLFELDYLTGSSIEDSSSTNNVLIKSWCCDHNYLLSISQYTDDYKLRVHLINNNLYITQY